jgi:tRNA A37 N6-isopentenylltransferase MiaA
VHHLLDVLDVTEPASVAQFQVAARNTITDCHVRGVVPILVGGSALYVRAVLDRFVFPGTDERLRSRLETELALRGPVALHDRLRAVDPLAASQILAGNARRVVRALEVIELTGKPFVASLPAYDYVHAPVVQIGLDVPRPCSTHASSSACSACGPRGWSTRSARWNGPACAGDGPPREPSATPRCWPTLPDRSARSRRTRTR